MTYFILITALPSSKFINTSTYQDRSTVNANVRYYPKNLYYFEYSSQRTLHFPLCIY
uniref:Uncharacterized protein n=1 Tax=Octopus bimaculoides TaxID=37653 RepID=A0A0L8HEF5_OCTBM